MTLILFCISIVLAQDFEGLKWTVVDDPSPAEGPSQWVVQEEMLQQLSNIFRSDREYEFWQGTHIVAGSNDWTDYVLYFDMNSEDDDGIGATVRYQDKDNYYRYISVSDGQNNGPFRRLEKFVNGERIVLAENTDSYNPGQTYHMMFKAIGNNLEVWIDGAKALSCEDSSFRSGMVGFLTYADTGFAVWNVRISDPAGNLLGGNGQDLAQEGALEPVPPRTGPNSVQLIIGETDNVILNIIPPRLYTSGAPIPTGTPCTIVIYRSKSMGAPGTYTEEVGRAEGAVTAPNDLQSWMVVKANAGPDDPLNDVIYLACTAVIGGIESEQNNQWLTINWHPQEITEWDVVQFPRDAGAHAGGIMPNTCHWNSFTPDQRAFVGQPGGVFPLRDIFPAGSYFVHVGPAGKYGLDTPKTWNTFGPYNVRGGHKYRALIESGSAGTSLPIVLRWDEDTGDLNPYSKPEVGKATVYARNNVLGDIFYAICLTPVDNVPVSTKDTMIPSETGSSGFDNFFE